MKNCEGHWISEDLWYEVDIRSVGEEVECRIECDAKFIIEGPFVPEEESGDEVIVGYDQDLRKVTIRMPSEHLLILERDGLPSIRFHKYDYSQVRVLKEVRLIDNLDHILNNLKVIIQTPRYYGFEHISFSLTMPYTSYHPLLGELCQFWQAGEFIRDCKRCSEQVNGTLYVFGASGNLSGGISSCVGYCTSCQHVVYESGSYHQSVISPYFHAYHKRFVETKRGEKSIPLNSDIGLKALIEELKHVKK